MNVGDRVLPRGNHRHATIVETCRPKGWVRVRCDCTMTFDVDPKDIELTPGAPPDDCAIGPNIGHTGDDA